MIADPDSFRKDKEIDPTQLDVECVRQASRTHYWAEAAIDASFEEEQAKFQYDLIGAKLDIAIRNDPEKFGMNKVTEAGVKAAIQLHPDLQASYNTWMAARKLTKRLNAAVKAMDDKKRMLQGLITLHGQQYFAGPDVPRDLLASWMESQEGSEKKVNKLQQTRTRTRKRP